MYKRILLALDLEGVNNVCGEPYLTLNQTPDYEVAKREAVLEINAAADALFAAGADVVALWDNHGGGGNVDRSLLDGRIKYLPVDTSLPRQYFVKGEYDAICYFGYHTMEGTLGGVLAHTMNSKAVQYYKINSKLVGEVDIDSYISAEYGVSSCFYCGGDLSCKQAEVAVPGIITVVTKKELSRNRAQFRESSELIAEIREKIALAIERESVTKKLAFPATIEKSFKRVEDAQIYYERLINSGVSSSYFKDDILGFDAHTVVSVVKNIDEFICCI